MFEGFTQKGTLLSGVFVAGIANLIALAIAAAMLYVPRIGGPLLAWFGLLQWVWIIPLYLKCRRAGETETAKGILLGGGITFLLSAACMAAFVIAWNRVYQHR